MFVNRDKERKKKTVRATPHLVEIIIEVGVLEKPVLGRELSGDMPARGYRRRGLERHALERDISGG